MSRASDYDVVVVGSGVAGSAARSGSPVVGASLLVTSRCARQRQHAVGAGRPCRRHRPDDDSARARHRHGGCRRRACATTACVRSSPSAAPHAVAELIGSGAQFDRDPDGRLALTREGGHTSAACCMPAATRRVPRSAARWPRRSSTSWRSTSSSTRPSSTSCVSGAAGERQVTGLSLRPAGADGCRATSAPARSSSRPVVSAACSYQHQPGGGRRRRARTRAARRRVARRPRVRAVPPDRPATSHGHRVRCR